MDAFEINFSCPHGLPERRWGRCGVGGGGKGYSWAGHYEHLGSMHVGARGGDRAQVVVAGFWRDQAGW